MACGAPDPSLGAAQRYAQWFDCNARSLGEDGFLGLAGFVVDSGILAGLLTILIALIGYRLLLGGKLRLGEGVGWAVKIGIVLALLGGWTAFQTLFYQLAVAGPEDIARRTLLASGIPLDETAIRFQRVYDALRLGLEGSFATAEGGEAVRAQPALPITATTFLTVAIGAVGIAKLLSGFFLAIAPLPIALMLFGPGLGLFVGWLRVLTATVVATAGLVVNSFLCLLALESEVSRMQSLGVTTPGLMDEQAPAAVVAIFFLLAVAIIVFSAMMTRGLAERIWRSDIFDRDTQSVFVGSTSERSRSTTVEKTSLMAASTTAIERSTSVRSAQLASAFDRTDRIAAASAPSVASARQATSANAGYASSSRSASGSAASARRALGRRHRSSARRDSRR